MNKNLTEIIFILDRSGSMHPLEADTIGGYNSFLDQQRELPGKVLLSTVLFDTQIDVLHDRADIAKVPALTSADYSARGCTALLDAVQEAGKFGIDANSAVTFRADSEGVRTNFDAVSMAAAAVRATGDRGTAWREKIERTFRRER